MRSRFWKAGLLAAGLMAWGLDSQAVERAVPPPDFPPLYKEMKISEFLKIRTRDIRGPGGERLNLKQRASFEWLKISMKRTLKREGDQTVGQYLASAKARDPGILIVVIIVGVLLILVLISGPLSVWT